MSYDELALFHENAEEFGIPYHGPPTVRREQVALNEGRHLSALVWGDRDPGLVFLHGGAQNAHTWDTVALALDRPLVCIDLPGHGHSGAPAAGPADPASFAADVVVAARQLAPRPGTVVGMSLGGLTALALSQHAPDLVRRLVLVDVTPGVNQAKAARIAAFVNGPDSFADFDELLARTIEHNPNRSVSSLRRGILHNAYQRADGRWVWRYARYRAAEHPGAAAPTNDAGEGRRFQQLWEAVSAFEGPLMLVRGMRDESVIDDDDEAELLRRCPHARVERVASAGHSVQGEDPVGLARLVDEFSQTPTSVV